MSTKFQYPLWLVTFLLLVWQVTSLFQWCRNFIDPDAICWSFFNSSRYSMIPFILFIHQFSMYSFHESLIPFSSIITLPDTPFNSLTPLHPVFLLPPAFPHTHNHFTALLDFVCDYPAEPASTWWNQSGFTGARDSEWQRHQLGYMQICTLTQTHNHASIPPLSFLQAGCPSCQPTNSVKALKAIAICFAIRTILFWWLGLFKSLSNSFCFFPFAKETTLFVFCLLFLYSFHASVDFYFFQFPYFSSFPLLLLQIPHSTTIFPYPCMGILTIHVTCAVSIIIFFICCRCSFTSRYFHSASTT